ncbi:hypothetical protein D9M69_580550 [compost metagenome]
MKHTAAMAVGLNSRVLPLISSATISPWAMARWASIGSPLRSPMAYTLRMLVWQRLSILIEEPFMSRFSASRFQPWVFGLRPTATSTWSVSRFRVSPFGSNTCKVLLEESKPCTLCFK